MATGRVHGLGDKWADMQLSDFRISEEIHRSSSGAVYKAQHRKSGTRVVLKEKKSAEMGAGRSIDNEAVLLAHTDHPNVIRCYGTFTDVGRRSFFMVLEDAAGGDLQSLLRARAARRDYLGEGEVLSLFAQISRGVAHLHERNIVHRDLKSLNVVLDASGVPKVCDLGVSRLRSEDTVFLQSFHGTPLYLSPELVDNEPYTEKTDVWSLGVILYQLASLKLPFEGSSLGQIVGLIKSGTYAPLPRHFSRHLTKLLAAMLHRKASQRPTLPEIVKYCEELAVHFQKMGRAARDTVEPAANDEGQGRALGPELAAGEGAARVPAARGSADNVNRREGGGHGKGRAMRHDHGGGDGVGEQPVENGNTLRAVGAEACAGHGANKPAYSAAPREAQAQEALEAKREDGHQLERTLSFSDLNDTAAEAAAEVDFGVRRTRREHAGSDSSGEPGGLRPAAGGGIPPAAACSPPKTATSEREERLRRRAADFAAHRAQCAGEGAVPAALGLGMAGGEGRPAATEHWQEPAPEPGLPTPARHVPPGPSPSNGAAISPAAAGHALNVERVAAEDPLRQPRQELSNAISRAAASTPEAGTAGGGATSLPRVRGILPGPQGGEGGANGRQILLARREEERRHRLLQGSPSRAPPSGSPGSAFGSPSTPGQSSAGGSDGHAAESEMYALAARMQRMQLEAALWKDPWQPAGSGASRPRQLTLQPRTLQTPPDSAKSGSGSSSALSRRSYNIFTHQWEELPIQIRGNNC